MDLPVDFSFEDDLSGPLISTQPENVSSRDLKSTKIPYDLSPIEAPNLSPALNLNQQLSGKVKNEKPISARKLFFFEKSDRDYSPEVSPLNQTKDNQVLEKKTKESKSKIKSKDAEKKVKSLKKQKKNVKLSFELESKNISLARPFAQFAKQKDSDLNENLFTNNSDLIEKEASNSLEHDEKEENNDKKESSESSGLRYFTEIDCHENGTNETYKNSKESYDEEDTPGKEESSQALSEKYFEKVESSKNKSKDENVNFFQTFSKRFNELNNKRKIDSQEKLENKRIKKDTYEDEV